MQVRCNSVTYFNRGATTVDGQPTTAPAASVAFSSEGNSSGQLDQFTLTFTNLEENLEYFPGKLYELTIAPVQE